MERKTQGSAGHDLVAKSLARLPEVLIVGTGEMADIPPGFVGLLVLRSSVAIALGTGTLNGVGIIDSDYKDEIKVLLPMLSGHKIDLLHTMISRGDRIAQLVIVPYYTTTEAPHKREGGLGSTGK